MYLEVLEEMPTELLASQLSVPVATVIEWKIAEEVPEEYQELMSSLPKTPFEKLPLTGVVEFKDAPELIAMPDVSKELTGLAICPRSMLSKNLLASTTVSVTASLKDWVTAVAKETKSLDIIWSLITKSGGASGQYVMKEPFTGQVLKFKLLDVFKVLMHSEVVAQKKKTDYLEALTTPIEKFVLDAQMAAENSKLQEMLANSEADPEKILEAEIERIVSEWSERHVTGGPDNPEIVPILTKVQRVEYRGRVEVTASTIGTVYEVAREEDKDVNILYTGCGLKMRQSSFADLPKGGLGSIVPETTVRPSERIPSALCWLMPSHESQLKEVLDKYSIPTRLSKAISMLESALLNTFLGYKHRSVSQKLVAAGISYTHDHRVGASKISPDAFNYFPMESDVPRPFRHFTAALLGGHKVFWGLLYSSLIPHEQDRKSLLYLAGTGSSFKSTFIGKIYRRMLELTIYEKGGKVKVRRNSQLELPVLQLTTQNDIQGKGEFGDIQNQHYVAKVIEEVKAFNIESKRFLGIKKQLGTNTIPVKQKFVNGSFQVPISQLVIADSNFTPIDPSYLKESTDRVAECCVFSQSYLLSGCDEYLVKSGNEHLYFHLLLSEEERKEAKEIIGRDYCPRDLEETYLPYLLFKTLMTFGKRCYQDITGESQDVPKFSTIEQRSVDRKSLAVAYMGMIGIGQVGHLHRQDSLPSTTPRTLIANLLRAGMEQGSEEDKITEEQIDDLVFYVYSQIKDVYIKDSKKTVLIKLRQYVWRNLLNVTTLDNYIGKSDGNYRLVEEDNGRALKGFKLSPLVLSLIQDDKPMDLASLQQEFISLLRSRYIQRVKAMKIEDLLLLSRSVTEVDDEADFF